MNIIGIRQEQRSMKVRQIVESIKRTLENGKTINYNKLVLSVKVNENLSDATTKDYISRALYILGITKEQLADPLTPALFKIENGANA